MDLAYYIKLPFAYLLNFLTEFTGSYGVALLLFALIVKLILLPISAKSKKSMMKMSRMTPKVKALEKKYANDKEKYQLEVNKLYKEEGVSTCSGCLWSFVPLLLLIPLYEVIREPITWLMGVHDQTVITAIKDFFTNEAGIVFTKDVYWQIEAMKHIPEYLPQLQQISPLVHSINATFLGIDLSSIPNWKIWTETLDWNHIGLFLLPLISGGFNWLSMWISQKTNNTVITDDKGEQDEAAAKAAQSNKLMNLMMPIMSIVFGFMWPAGMSLYWIAQAVLGIAQDYFLTMHYRKVYDAEDAIKQQKAAEEAALEAERERIRQERREANPDGIVENTSKKKLQQKQKAEKAAAEAAYLAKHAPAKEGKKPLSGDPERPFSRGRAYMADRYDKDQEEDNNKE